MTKEEFINNIEEQREISLKEAITKVMGSHEGRTFVKYLLDSFNVFNAAPIGLYGDQLIDYNSYLRAGNTILKLILKNNPELTGTLITEMEMENQNYETAIKNFDESTR